MLLIRSTLFFILLLINTILFAIPVFTIGMLMPFRPRCQMANAWARVTLWLLKITCNLKHEIRGWDNLAEHAAIIMSKHQSAWETIAMRGLFPPEQAWILKRELMWIPFFGWALAAVGSIGINRNSGRSAIKQVITKGTERLQKGRLVMIFPEGTRVAPGERKKYGMGGALLAEKSGYPIIPVAHNAGVFWRRRGIIKYPGTIQMVIGQPIETKNKKANEIIAEVEEWIEATVAVLPQSPDGEN
jgi:1-acyl-sn-glycerol-3-phosphate acyltransferase